jgi:archaellum component FlaG (FlaF/FlaG flagellin family)
MVKLRAVAKGILRWLGKRPYTKAMWMNTAATMGMLIVSLVMTCALSQNKKALKVAVDSLDIQRSEFRLQNRPWLSFESAQLSGPAQDLSGQEYEHTIAVRVMNVGTVPAIMSQCTLQGMLDGKEVRKTSVQPIAVTSNQTSRNHLFLPQEVYNSVVSGQHGFEVRVDIRYGGPLNVDPNAFHLTATASYLQKQGEFEIVQNIHAESPEK